MEGLAQQTTLEFHGKARAGYMRPRRALFLADLSAVALATGISYLMVYLRSGFNTTSAVTAVITTIMGLAVLILLVQAGQYSNRRRVSALTDIGTFVRCLFLGSAVTILLGYLTKGFFTGINDPSRLTVGSWVLILLVFGVASRIALQAYQSRLFSLGVGVRRILVVGAGKTADELKQHLQAHPAAGAMIVAQIAPTVEAAALANGCPEDNIARPVIALPSGRQAAYRLHQTMHESGATGVVVALDEEDHTSLPRITELLVQGRIPFGIMPSLFEQSYQTIQLLGLSEVPVIDVRVDPLDRTARLFKRILDVCGSTLALLSFSPLMGLVSLAIALDSGFPIIFKQQRVGKNGKCFSIYKFRTMVVHAETLLDGLKSRDEGDGPHFKMANDPRLTRVGSWLRKWSLDELPQFANVLRGEMSLVGPRPPLPREVQKYETSDLARLQGKPGMTGLWQVSGRKRLSFEDMVNLDRYYLNNWSLRMDVSILIRTVLAVLGRKGAY